MCGVDYVSTEVEPAVAVEVFVPEAVVDATSSTLVICTTFVAAPRCRAVSGCSVLLR